MILKKYFFSKANKRNKIKTSDITLQRQQRGSNLRSVFRTTTSNWRFRPLGHLEFSFAVLQELFIVFSSSQEVSELISAIDEYYSEEKMKLVCSLHGQFFIENLSTPEIEPGPPGEKPGILTTRPHCSESNSKSTTI
ncbi:hypothetical protein CDAR_83681 [Caerostris darwini]|uniref:Uncharacterized protein n=1 Tax=Caerostris darwini TaxID=1538125 RepID=A0AAV4QFH3_9ARAC|nr:hypothetical protein CDAR_83681 [Caerostris darwini]